MIEIRLPKVGMEMTEGVIDVWLVDDGERVEEGAGIYVLETDKVEMQVEAPSSGILRHVGIPGTVYNVGDLIGRIE